MALITPAAAGRTAREVVATTLTRRDRDLAGLIMLVLLLLAAGLTLLVLLILLATIINDAWPVVTERGTAFITDTIGSNAETVGIWPGLYGSFFIGLGVVVVSIPLGVAAAIYLEEYASQGNRLTRMLLVNIRNLAGVPAVIYGVLGLILFVQWLEPVTNGETVIAAGLTMAVLVLPIIIITSMEAIRAVPQGLRDAGYGVGASRWEVTRDHVLPYAAPGILTGTVLSIACARRGRPTDHPRGDHGTAARPSVNGRFTALPMLIYNWSGRPDQPGSTIGWANAAAAAGLVLLVLVLFFNVAAILLRNRFERRRAGT